jgi:hypothetical protein
VAEQPPGLGELARLARRGESGLTSRLAVIARNEVTKQSIFGSAASALPCAPPSHVPQSVSCGTEIGLLRYVRDYNVDKSRRYYATGSIN